MITVTGDSGVSAGKISGTGGEIEKSKKKKAKDSEKAQTRGSFKTFYKLGKELGRGNYSTVRLGEQVETSQIVAVKCIRDADLDQEDRDALHIEIEILRELDHPNIIKFFDFFPEKPVYYIITEYVGGGELFDRIVEKEFYSEKDAAKVVTTVASALKYCHDRGIVHRDLKPENILLTKNEKGIIDDGNIKLADFGFAKSIPNVNTLDTTGAGGLTTSCGTPGYVAPEILKGKVYGKEVDLWSLGVILYILLCGYPPFLEDDGGRKGLFDKIKKADYSFEPEEYWKDVSELGKELIRCLLVVDATKRLTIDQVLEHKWVKIADIKEEEGEKANDITAALKQLKQYQARKKWKLGIHAIKAANRMSTFAATSKLAKLSEASEGSEAKDEGKARAADASEKEGNDMKEEKNEAGLSEKKVSEDSSLRETKVEVASS